MTQKNLVMEGKNLIIRKPGMLITRNCVLSGISRYNLFAHLFDGGFAPKLYINLKVYVLSIAFLGTN